MDQRGSDSGEMRTSMVTMLRGQWAMEVLPTFLVFLHFCPN